MGGFGYLRLPEVHVHDQSLHQEHLHENLNRVHDQSLHPKHLHRQHEDHGHDQSLRRAHDVYVWVCLWLS